jgi:acyl-[acyl-carrier-protein]-phospholipid O-acyltransferase/long-chain-fatty-acid--[acyl-carrier-protein] ligase
MAVSERRHPAVTEETFNRKGFWALIVTQFQGAFNDNLYKYLMIFFLVGLVRDAGLLDVQQEFDILGWTLKVDRGPLIYSAATFVFSLPFIFFAAFAGALSDRYSKQRVAVGTKYLEVAVMALGGVAFLVGEAWLVWPVLFLMATQSAIFGPAKYGIMPEILPEPRLSWGNGILQMGTVVAVIAGTALAGPLYTGLEDQVYLTALVLMGFSVVGLITAHFITRPPAANPGQRLPRTPIGSMGRYFGVILRDKILFYIVIGYVYFWFAGAFFQQNVLNYADKELHLNPAFTSYLLAAVGLGIAIGALAAGYLSRGKIELGLIPIGSVGMTLFAMLISFPPPAGMEAGADGGASGYFYFAACALFGLGFFAGVFDVPLAASIQERAPDSMKGGVIAATNMLTWFAMAFSAILYFALAAADFNAYHIFLVTAVLSLGIGLLICLRLPVTLLRAALWFATSTVYRLRVRGRDNLPDKGGALYVANHISLIDALFILASTDRDMYFLAGSDVYSQKWSRRIAKWLNIITVEPHGSPAQLEETMREVRRRIEQGYVVCIPSEARFAADGPEMPWHSDYQILLGELDVPVVPVHITRLWGTLYEFRDGTLQRKSLKKLPQHIVVHYGETLPARSPAFLVREKIQWLGTDSYMQRPLRFDQLHRGFIRMARKHLKSMAIADQTTGELSYFKTLVGSIVFGRKLNALLDKQKMVGVLVPPTVGGTLTNIALQIMGRVPVNLNYSASKDALASAIRQCNITQVITARQVIERLQIELPVEAIFLEDIRPTVSGKDRIIGMLLGLLAPVRLIEYVCGSRGRRRPSDLATIIFSSGSEGDPKGVMLTQHNILTNIEAAMEIFPHGRGDCMLGFLPFFHSFGFTGTLWMTLLSGLRAAFHPNPLEPKVIGQLAEKYQASFLIGTSTFLQGFIRRCTPEQFAALNFVVCGAEKLATRVREAFKEKFGVEPLEGYGTTECAPVVSVNVPDLKSPGFYSMGTKHGTIGRPVPGVSVQVIDTETHRPVPPGVAGLLLVKGPNIMQGYLGLERKTSEVLRDGWYETGDIAALDEDGFITITDRLARFSKIGGEMVPHNKVEEILHEILGLTDHSLAVASVPDEQKGERLIVLHCLSDDQVKKLIAGMAGSDLPNLWRPRANSFYHIDAIPVMATGKMDIKTVKKMAQAFDVGE